MLIYCHEKRFDPQFSDCVQCESLQTEVSTKGGGQTMAAAQLIERWLANHPNGAITITAEDE